MNRQVMSKLAEKIEKGARRGGIGYFRRVVDFFRTMYQETGDQDYYHYLLYLETEGCRIAEAEDPYEAVKVARSILMGLANMLRKGEVPKEYSPEDVPAVAMMLF